MKNSCCVIEKIESIEEGLSQLATELCRINKFNSGDERERQLQDALQVSMAVISKLQDLNAFYSVCLEEADMSSEDEEFNGEGGEENG